MKKDASFEWDEDCQHAFESIKAYLTKPLVLSSPIRGKPLVLYITALKNSLAAFLAQENEAGKENVLYYLSRTLVGLETRYSPIEKLCLALIFVIQKLRHYLQHHHIRLISKADPLKYILRRPTLNGWLAKWAVLLQQYDLEYVPQKAIKGQVLADFLATHPALDTFLLVRDLPDEGVMIVNPKKGWEIFFDGASRSPIGTRNENIEDNVARIGILFVSLDNALIPYYFSHATGCSNKTTEYEAVITGLELALQIPVTGLTIYSDSKLGVKQLREEYNVKKAELIPTMKRPATYWHSSGG